MTIDLDAAERVAQSLIVGGLLKPGRQHHRPARHVDRRGLNLRVRDLTISYGGEPVLEGASLAVEHGQFVSLVGPSGSGKSSLLRAVIGLQPPLAGTVEPGVAPSEIGILFQDDALLPWKTARDNVALGLALRRHRAARARWRRPTTGSTALGLAGFERPLSRAISAAASGSASRSRRCWR